MSYSADVRMQLNIAGHALKIGQLGPDFIILAKSVELPPARGEITMSIDGRVRRWPVWLPEGISGERERTRTKLAD